MRQELSVLHGSLEPGFNLNIDKNTQQTCSLHLQRRRKVKWLILRSIKLVGMLSNQIRGNTAACTWPTTLSDKRNLAPSPKTFTRGICSWRLSTCASPIARMHFPLFLLVGFPIDLLCGSSSVLRMNHRPQIRLTAGSGTQEPVKPIFTSDVRTF